MNTAHISEYKNLIPELVELRYLEWRDLYEASGISKDDLSAYISTQVDPNVIPFTIILTENGTLVGGGGIKCHESSTKDGLSPWVGGLYIKTEYRGRGLGLRLLHALEEQAKSIGVKTLYLSADSAEEFYIKNGWSVMEYVESCGVRRVALMSKDL